MKRRFRLGKPWIAVVVIGPILSVVVLFGLVQTLINDPGPSAEKAFRRFIKDPIPASVTHLRIHYDAHMRGYWIYLVFQVDPNDVGTIFDLTKFDGSVPYIVTDGETEYPGWTDEFKKLDTDGFADMMTKGSYFSQGIFDEADTWMCRVVISDDHRKVYWSRFRD